MFKLLLDDNPADGGGSSSEPHDDNGQASSPVAGDKQTDGDDTPVSDDQSDNGDTPPSDPDGDGQVDDQQNGQPDDDDQQQQPETFESEQAVPDAEADKPGDEKLRFSAHPRWKELIAEKNRYKEQVNSQQSAVEQTNALNNVLAQHGIPVQEFQGLLEYAILKRTNPSEAYRRLATDYQVLGQMAGAILPEDLQTAVAGGSLDPNLAKEIAAGRARERYQQWQQSTQGQMQQTGVQSVVQQTTNQWAQLKQSVDPDFKPGSKLFQTTDLFLAQIVRQSPPANAMQAQANLENAYNQAKAYIKSFGGGTTKPAAQTPRRNGQPPSRPSSPSNRVSIKNAEDAVKAILSGGGKAPANIRFA
ncbi:MAG: hypothetical protein KGL39_08585 [Patescibacteria group bacterium]|nr:hypothetical protein [Patescibacteria group bacterium]